MKYARVANQIVQEVFVEPAGFSISECFHSDVCSLFEQVNDDVEVGYVKHQDGTFTAPVPVEIPVTNT